VKVGYKILHQACPTWTLTLTPISAHNCRVTEEEEGRLDELLSDRKAKRNHPLIIVLRRWVLMLVLVYGSIFML
jgi:hypothetical protein